MLQQPIHEGVTGCFKELTVILNLEGYLEEQVRFCHLAVYWVACLRSCHPSPVIPYMPIAVAVWSKAGKWKEGKWSVCSVFVM